MAYINLEILDILFKLFRGPGRALRSFSNRGKLSLTGEKYRRLLNYPIFSAVVFIFSLSYTSESLGQSTTIVNYNFNTGSSYATLTPILEPNINSDITSSDSWRTPGTGIKSGTHAFTANTTAGKVVKIVKGETWDFTISGNEIANYRSFSVYYQISASTSSKSPVLDFEYSLDGLTYSATGITAVVGGSSLTLTTSFKECELTLPSSLDNPDSPIYFRLTTSGGFNNTTFNLDNFQVQAYYNAISTSAISGTSLCAGSNVSVPYTISGAFLSGNSFTAELSDQNGNFAPPISIGTVTRTTAGTISATIPSDTPEGSGYRIRVTSDNPKIKGTDNGTDLTVNLAPAITSQPSMPAATCSGSGTQTLSVSATGSGLAYSWRKGGVAVVNSSIISGQGTATLKLTGPTVSQAGSYDVVVSGACSSVTSDAVTVTVNTPTSITTQPAAPAATCSGSGTQILTVTAEGTGLSYSWRKGGVAVVNSSIISGQGTATLKLTGPTVSQAGSYDVVVSGTCSSVTSNAVSVTVNRDGYWTGAVSTDWNNVNNWECGELPNASTNVSITNGKSRYPLLSSGVAGTVKNLTIESASSLTVSGNTLTIAGTINTTGTFTATSGTIELNGGTGQTIPANTFAGNTVMDLTINNLSGVTLGGALNISGIVWPVSGTLNTGGYLTLLSTSSQTALISGSGNGSIAGNLNIQRYITNAFGYKYFSSPVGNATVAQLSGYLSTTATIPAIYSYDENNMNSGAAISGWINYTSVSNPLNVMEGYAVNLGSSATSDLVTISGSANNGSYSRTLYNHNGIYTQGFNLVGNPYPSPIDWNAVAGWTRTNIDGAIYFFSANGDEYSGTYSSYTNGIAGANGDNIIPAMQGFFVHVSTGHTSGILGMTNNVRINKMNPTYKSTEADYRNILRFNASFDEKTSIPDPFVLYFDPASTPDFDTETDALKLMNTNQSVPNIYAITPDVRQLSISGIPLPSDSLTRIPLGVKLLRNGWVNFSAQDISQLPASFNIYLYDSENKTYNDLKTSPNYRFYLKSGEYNQRFVLLLSKSNLQISSSLKEKPFNLTRNGSVYQANIFPGSIESGTLYVRNMAGQTMQEIDVSGQQTIEICQGAKSGVYIVTIVSGNRIFSEKTLIIRE